MRRLIQSIQVGYKCGISAWKMLGKCEMRPVNVNINMDWEYRD